MGAERAARLSEWLTRLARPRRVAIVFCLAMLLTVASIGRHRVLDDHVLELIAQGAPDIAGLSQGRFDLFTFTTGVPADNRALMDQGVMLPWWTEPALRISFFRPLTSATHQLDFAFWPGSAVGMHIHSWVWFGIMLLAVARVYARLERGAFAGLAFAAYALDDAHGPALSWISNRSALISVSLCCLVLLLHHRARYDRRVLLRVAAPLALLLALLAGEFSLGIGAYLFAYAVYLDPGTARERSASLVPYALVVICWRLGYQWGGHGAFGSGAYVDPARQFAEYVAVLPEKVALLLHGQLSAPPSDLAFVGPPGHRPLLVAVAVATLGLFAWLLRPVVVADRTARFWMLGSVLACLPLVASFPSDRLLLLVGLGGAPLIARLCRSALDDGQGGRPGRLRTGVIALVAGLHLMAAPALLPFRARQMEFLGTALSRATARMGSATDAGRWVLLNAPVDLMASYLPAERATAGRPRPESWNWLATASSPIAYERVSETDLVVTPAQGFLYSPLERHYRGDATSLPPGSRVELSSVRAQILRVLEDGRPAAVRFSLTRPIDEYAFFQWEGDRYERIALPAVGSRWTLPAADFGEIVFRGALHDFGVVPP